MYRVHLISSMASGGRTPITSSPSFTRNRAPVSLPSRAVFFYLTRLSSSLADYFSFSSSCSSLSKKGLLLSHPREALVEAHVRFCLHGIRHGLCPWEVGWKALLGVTTAGPFHPPYVVYNRVSRTLALSQQHSCSRTSRDFGLIPSRPRRLPQKSHRGNVIMFHSSR
jgi:hypothetical protein